MARGGSKNLVHEFTLILGGVTDLSDDTLKALFEAGCDDATPCLRAGRVFLAFDREGPRFKDAVISALRDVRRAGIGATVIALDECDRVSQADIARRIGRTRQQVGQYVTGTRGPGGFPAPAARVGTGHALWDWSEVSQWLERSGIVATSVVEAAQVIKTVNSVLEFRDQQARHGTLVEEVLSLINDPTPTSTG